MTYEEFLKFIPAKCMYEAVYDDSDGRTILVIRMLDAYRMVNQALDAAQPTQESEEQRMLRRKWFGHRDTEHLSFVEAVEITMTTLMQQEQPAQEPKSVTYKEVADTMNALRKGNFSQQAAAKEVGELKLYTTPPQRSWVGLTPEEIWDSTYGLTRIQKDDWVATDADLIEFAHIIEAKLKEKNT